MTRQFEAYDFVIVGGGTAGCVLAARLTEDPSIKVLLLEAGGSDRHWSVRIPGGAKENYLPGTPRNWSYETEPQSELNGRRLPQPRGKVIGGSSSINGMVFLRGHPLDYDRWEAEGARGWSYRHVLPYFKRLENWKHEPSPYRGTSGPVTVQRVEAPSELDAAFLEAGRQAGQPFTTDVNGPQQEGLCLFDMNVDHGYRASASHAYLRPVRHRPNLTVRTQSTVHRVQFEGLKAAGVMYRHGGVVREVTATREVVLCAGAFATPHILMVSGLGPAQHLREAGVQLVADAPGIGGNLQDHIEIYIQHKCKRPLSLNGHLKWHRKVVAGLQWVLFKAGEAAYNQARTGAFLCSSRDVPHPDIQVHFFAAFMNGWEIPPDTHGYRVSVGPMRPEARGVVRLRSADPTAPPIIDPRYMTSERDWNEMREGYYLARDILGQRAFWQLDAGLVEPVDEPRDKTELDEYIRGTVGSGYHPCGTCRMGDPTQSATVCDSFGAVLGVSNLRICDASLMPSIPSSNINAIVMMMAEKISDHLLGRPPLEADLPA